MREAISRILRIGLVNSGMFDSLVLNTDVRAVHLVGDNNVGKTSLIELIQFLYFPSVSDMRFSKSTPETLSFYFRPEGSYLLFEVRTVHGRQRTLGIFGTGTADSRTVFVFDGSFELGDFLDEQQRVVSLQQAGQRLASRRLYIYQRVEDHERGLNGEHSDDRANIQLFDLPKGNFRLLRRLLQNLLRLERLTSREIRQFFNALVESAGAKTRIDIARDFERKYTDIKAIRERIAALNRLKPLIEQWTAARDRLERVLTDEQNARHRLGHVARRYIDTLNREQQALTNQLTNLTATQHELEEERQRLADALGEERSALRQVEALQQEHRRLEQQCAGHHEAEVRAEREALTLQAVTLQQRIHRMATISPEGIERRLARLRTERERLLRQLEQRTLDHMLAEAGLSEDTLALLHFLLAESLLSLPVSGAVADTQTLIAAAHEAMAMVDEAGVFRGFGLKIPRAEWYQPRAQEQPVAERLADIERQIVEAEQELDVARDRAHAQRELQDIQVHAAGLEQFLRAFERLRELEEREGGPRGLKERTATLNQRITELMRRRQPIDERSRSIQNEQVTVRADLHTLDQTRRDVSGLLRELDPAADACPEDIASLDASGLAETFPLARQEHLRRRSALQPAQATLNETQTRLADLHEFEAPDVPFETWVADKQRLTSEIERLEQQLLQSYANLMALVKGELDKLTRAFEDVRSQVAGLNTMIRRVSISNIERIELHVQESHLVEAIRQTSQIQLDLFTPMTSTMPLELAEQQIEEFVVGTLRAQGRELSLDDLFQLEFQVTFAHTGEQRTVPEIHAFESNGTAIGVKIVIYLGMIKLLQGNRRGIVARIPFFLDEVGSLSSNNVRQIIAYCDEHNFLPIFASPTVRDDIPHSYILRRFGERSQLVNEMILTEGEPIDANAGVGSAARA